MFKILCERLIIIISLLFSVFSFAQQKTLLNKDGEIIRATAIAVAKNYENTSNKFCEDPQTWQTIKDLHLNAVRVCWVDPWFERRGYNAWKVDDPKVTEILDKAVKNAVDHDMTIIINYHSAGDQAKVKKKHDDENSEMLQPEGFKRIKRFWEIIAPRYKDNPNVIYEIINEPTFSTNDYLKDPFKKDFLEVYKMVRKEAPEREIIMFSFNGINYDFEPVISGYHKDIDWDKTSIGYHLYQKDRSDQVRRLGRNYRVICTEWDYPETHRYVMPVDGYDVNTEFFEVYNHSWMDWSDWGNNTLNNIKEIMIPHAKKNGYQWWGNASKNKNIIVRAKGTKKKESLNVIVNGETIEKIKLEDTLLNYTISNSKNVKELKLELEKVKKKTEVMIDYVAIDGKFKDAEDQMENTSVFQKETCGGILSDQMNCAGHINFGSFEENKNTSSNKKYTIKIKAKGAIGDEKMELLINGLIIKDWILSTSNDEYTCTTDAVGTVRVAHTNDNGKRDAIIDSVEINGKKYEAEDMPINTGVWRDKNCGGGFSDKLNCNGYIQFPPVVF